MNNNQFIWSKKSKKSFTWSPGIVLCTIIIWFESEQSLCTIPGVNISLIPSSNQTGSPYTNNKNKRKNRKNRLISISNGEWNGCLFDFFSIIKWSSSSSKQRRKQNSRHWNFVFFKEKIWIQINQTNKQTTVVVVVSWTWTNSFLKSFLNFWNEWKSWSDQNNNNKKSITKYESKTIIKFSFIIIIIIECKANLLFWRKKISIESVCFFPFDILCL